MLQTVKLLLPALVPSWRFFDVIAPSPRVEFTCLRSATDTPIIWHEFRPRPAQLPIRTLLRRLIWNPGWNDTLFVVSCAERLMDLPTDHSHTQILTRINAEIATKHPNTTHLQFRLVFVSRQGTELRKDITYVSPVHPRPQSPTP